MTWRGCWVRQAERLRLQQLRLRSRVRERSLGPSPCKISAFSNGSSWARVLPGWNWKSSEGQARPGYFRAHSPCRALTEYWIQSPAPRAPGLPWWIQFLGPAPLSQERGGEDSGDLQLQAEPRLHQTRCHRVLLPASLSFIFCLL